MLEYGELYLENNRRWLAEFSKRCPEAYALAVIMAEEDDDEEC